MNWIIFYCLSILLLVGTLVYSTLISRKPTRRRLYTPTNILLIGVMLSVIMILIPIYGSIYRGNPGSRLEAVLLSFHTMIRIFVVDGELSFVADSLVGIPEWLLTPYFIQSAVLYILAPLLTLGFVLSFFGNVEAYKRLLANRGTELYIFSELNEHSCALAHSIAKTGSKSLFVFAGVHVGDDERMFALRENVRDLGAVCLSDDIISLKLMKHSPDSNISFFAISLNEDKNI